MKIALLMSLFVLAAYGIQAQVKVRPVCDEAPIAPPLTWTYNGFIIQEDVTASSNLKEITIEVSEDEPQGNTLFVEKHRVAFNQSGYFSLQIGSENIEEFHDLIDYFNDNNNKEYFIDVYLISGSTSSVYLGSKLITTVPYAIVANALGGLGKKGRDGIQGRDGVDGEDGADGRDGQDGRDGIPGDDGMDGFEILQYLSVEPTSGNIKWYVDDGTNTADGKPHLRYKHNNIWIDL